MRYWRDRAHVNSKREEGKSVRFITVALFLVPFSLGLAGCAVQPVREAEPPLRVATAEQLIDLLRSRERALRTVKGLFTAQVKGPGIPIAQTVHGALFYRRPDALRLQGFSRFGGMLFDFVLEPDLYRLHLPTEGKLITGSPAELSAREGIAQSVRLSIFAMRGLVGIAAIAPNARVMLAEEGERYLLDELWLSDAGSENGSPFRRIWFDRRSLQVVREERYTPKGDLESRLELEEFRAFGPVPPGDALTAGESSSETALVLPLKITARTGQGGASIQVRFSELAPNVPLGERELQLAFRAGAGDNKRGRGETPGS